MDIIAIHHKELGGSSPETVQRSRIVCAVGSLGYPVEIYQETEENLVGHGTVFEDPKEIVVYGDRRHVFPVESHHVGGIPVIPVPLGHVMVPVCVEGVVGVNDLLKQQREHEKKLLQREVHNV